MTAKTRAIPSLHRDSFLAKVPSRVLGTARMLRRVKQPPFIAGPLGLNYWLPAYNKNSWDSARNKNSAYLDNLFD